MTDRLHERKEIEKLYNSMQKTFDASMDQRGNPQPIVRDHTSAVLKAALHSHYDLVVLRKSAPPEREVQKYEKHFEDKR